MMTKKEIAAYIGISLSTILSGGAGLTSYNQLKAEQDEAIQEATERATMNETIRGSLSAQAAEDINLQNGINRVEAENIKLREEIEKLEDELEDYKFFVIREYSFGGDSDPFFDWVE